MNPSSFRSTVDPKNSKKIVIAGGGISGLATAYHLTELARKESFPCEITVLEAKERFGGSIATQSRDGFLLEEGPEAFVAGKPSAIDLCKRLGMESEIIETLPGSRCGYIYRNQRLVKIPEGFYLLAPTRARALWTLPFLSLRGKIRMVCEPFIPPRKDGADESIGHFVRRRLGREALEWIAEPMLGGIFAGDVNRLSAQAILPHFRDMETKYGSIIKAFFLQRRKGPATAERSASGPRYALFRSLNKGMESLVRKLIGSMPEVKFHSGIRIQSIRQGNRWKVMMADGKTIEADALCLALPAYEASKLLEPVDPEVTSHLGSIPYESAAMVNLAFRKDDLARTPEGFGFVVPSKEGFPILSASFSSNKFSGRAPKDCLLARVFLGGSRERELLERDDKEIASFAGEMLHTLLGARKRPIFTVVTRHKKALPQYHVGHLKRIEILEKKLERLAGLFLTGSAYKGTGLPDCIRQGEETAEKIRNFIRLAQRKEPSWTQA
jgi:oxygen-dependent protoporphyrinogen oxidase